MMRTSGLATATVAQPAGFDEIIDVRSKREFADNQNSGAHPINKEIKS